MMCCEVQQYTALIINKQQQIINTPHVRASVGDGEHSKDVLNEKKR